MKRIWIAFETTIPRDQSKEYPLNDIFEYRGSVFLDKTR